MIDHGKTIGAMPDDGTPSAAWFAVGILVLMYILSLMDRQILSLLVTPLRHDLGLDDVEVGLLQGFAFVLLYATVAVPIGWAIDRFSRRMMIFLGVFTWSLSCIAGGFATGFAMLFVSRLGVGVGEAALNPGGFSILSDLFPRRRLSLALGIFSTGANLGVLVSFTLGGIVVGTLAKAGTVTLPLLGGLAPWKAAFIIAGLPGVLLAFLMFVIPEPPRHRRTALRDGFLGPLLRFFRANPKLSVAVFLGFTLNNMLGYSMLAWTPSYLERVFGWSSGEIGPVLGLAMGAGGACGPLLSGLVADRFFRRGVQDIGFRLSILCYIVMAPFGIVGYCASNSSISLLFLAMTYFLAASIVPNAATTIQLIAGPELRGRLAAAYLLVSSLIGQGLGPLFVATTTEHGFHDNKAVGFSLAMLICTASLLGIALLRWGQPSFLKLMNDSDTSRLERTAH